MAQRTNPAQAEERAETLRGRWARIAQLLVYAFIAVFPFVLGQRGNGDAVFNKERFTYMAVGAAGFAFLACYCVAWRAGQRPNGRILQRFKACRPYEKALLVYGLFTLVSFAFSADKGIAFLGVYSQNGGLWIQACYMATFFLVARYYRPRGRDIVIGVVAAAITAIIGLCQYFGYDFLHILPASRVGSLGKDVVFYSTMSNNNFYSTYLCLFFALGAGWMVHQENARTLLLLPALLLLFAMILFGGMRGGLVGIAGALALCIPVMLRGRKSLAKLFWLCAGLCLVLWLEDYARVYVEALAGGGQPMPSALRPVFLPCALICLALGAAFFFARDAWFAKFPKISGKWLRRGWYMAIALLLIIACAIMPLLAEFTGSKTLGELAAMLSGDFNDNYASARLYIWKRLFTLLPAHPIIGYGPDGFNAAFNARYAYALVDDWPEIMAPAVFDKAHNDFLQILVDGGILGFAAYIAFFIALLWCGRKKTGDVLVAAGICAVAAYIVQSNFNYTIPVNGPMVWIALSMYGAAIRAAKPPALDKKEVYHGKKTLDTNA